MTVEQLQLIHGARTYGRLDRGINCWVIRDLAPHVAIRLKQMFKRVPTTAAGQYALTKADDVAEDLLWFMVRYPLEVPGGIMKELRLRRKAAEASRAEADRILLPEWRPEKPARFNDGVTPYLYQYQAAALTRRMGRLMLMDDVGLGKTVSALTTLVESGEMPAAIVVQAHLGEQWAEFVTEFTDLKAHIIKSVKPYDLPPADIYIFKYSNIAGWVDIAAQNLFRIVVFDEMQELRHGTSTGKGRAAKVFCDHAALRMGLTATPIYNYGSEIFNTVNLLAPGELGEWSEFLREWCVGEKQVRDPEALGTYLRDQQIALRRTEDDVGGQMPAVNVLPVSVPYDERVAAAAEETARQLAIKVLEGSFLEAGRAARDLDMFARHQTGLAKARHVSGYVRILIEAGTPVLLAGWHRDVYDIWLKELSDLNPGMYTGTESQAAKRRTKEAFVSGETDLMIISLRSGAGLDGLQKRCRTVVFGELDWSPMVHRQVIGRLRRPGQQNQVDAVYCHADGGSDPVLIETLGIKSSQARGITDPLAGDEMVHSDDSRIRRLAEQYLKSTNPTGDNNL